MAWTAEQQAAIDDRGHQLLLSAAAGSGKTAVLVERIIQRILDPHDPIEITSLLVMTFTRAAALEMRTRIGLALAKAHMEQPTAHLERQLALLGTAQISTIHSFCMQVIRQYFYRLDLDAGYRQGTETELALWRARALEEALLSFYEKGDADFYLLADAFRERNQDTRLRRTVLRMYDYSRSLPFPEDWLDGLADHYAVDAAEMFAEMENERTKCSMRWALLVQDLQRAQADLQGYSGMEKAIAVLQQDIEYLRALSEAESWQAAYAALHQVEFARWPGGKYTDAEKEAKDAARDIRNRIKETLKAEKEGLLGTDPDMWHADIRAMEGPVRQLVAVTKDFGERFAAYKKQERLIDFSDLEHLCLSLLLAPNSTPESPQPSDTAKELSAQYVEVMVDEYQDTNGVQEMIAALVSRENNRFMVGDVKQSIYRFRLADPSIFMEKYDRYAAGEVHTRRIDLSRNFRSDPTILEAVNDIFRHIMHKAHAEIEYGPAEALYPGRDVVDAPAKWVGGPVSVRILIPNTEEVTERAADFHADDQISFDKTAATAHAIAQEMVRLRQSGAQVQEKDGSYRPVTWRDMTILMRSVTGVADRYIEILTRCGIPVYAEQRGGYFEAIEIQLILALLSVVDNPRRDLDVAAVLRSAIVGWDENELAALRLHVGEEPLFTGLEAVSLPATTRARTDRFLAWWKSWRALAQTEGVATLLRQIYEDTAYPVYISGWVDGVSRETNLEALYRRTREFDDSIGTGLCGFLRYIHRLKGENQDLSIPSSVGENEDVVRIMTIHKSKGLEFPIVFLAHMEKSFNMRDLTEHVLLHRKAGLGMERIHPEWSISYPTVWYHLLRERLRAETLAEEQRLLYVAMTRARDKLYLYGALSNKEDSAESQFTNWERNQSQGAIAKNYLDWIMPFLTQHPDRHRIQDPQSKHPRWDVAVERVTPMEKDCTNDANESTVDVARRLLADDIESGNTAVTDALQMEKISCLLDWSYPRDMVTRIPAKLTVTEIVHRRDSLADRTGIHTVDIMNAIGAIPVATDVYLVPDTIPDESALNQTNEGASTDSATDNEFAALPSFMREDTPERGVGKTYGTLVHRVLERVATCAPEDMKTEVARLCEAGIITSEEHADVSLHRLQAFAASDIGKRLRKAEIRYLEMPFGLALPANYIFADADLAAEQIYLQGVIDCLFIEDGEIVIVDYKTDRIDDVSELYDRYAGQLELYAYAVARIWNLPIRQKVLYSVRLGKSYCW